MLFGSKTIGLQVNTRYGSSMSQNLLWKHKNLSLGLQNPCKTQAQQYCAAVFTHSLNSETGDRIRWNLELSRMDSLQVREECLRKTPNTTCRNIKQEHISYHNTFIVIHIPTQKILFSTTVLLLLNHITATIKIFFQSE